MISHSSTYVTVQGQQCLEKSNVILFDYTGESTQKWNINDDGSISPDCNKNLVLYADEQNKIILRNISDNIPKTKFELYVFYY